MLARALTYYYRYHFVFFVYFVPFVIRFFTQLDHTSFVHRLTSKGLSKAKNCATIA